MRRAFDTEAMERTWLDRWASEKLYDAQRGAAGDPKFFLHFAYPGISGYLHVGHLRGFTYADVFTRYHRMLGHRVLFPAGFHASGIPSVGLARRVERRDPDTLAYLANNGCPPDQVPRLADPQEVVNYFSGVYRDDYWRRFGYLIDWRTLCTTIDAGYRRFIQWQFRRLKDKNLLVQKPHFAPFCPVDGAVAVDASETDISKGGNAEAVEFTIVRFRHADGTILPCATLRPETVFGATNLWLQPEATYVIVEVGAERWLLSEPAVEKLRGQRDDVGKVVGKVTPSNDEAWMAGFATNPANGAKVPVLPAPFVDPRRATGVVMSVPAHAPYDWQALQEARPDIQPIVVIENAKVQGVPAESAVRRHNVSSQADRRGLDAATEEVYADEFHAGTMASNTGLLAGMRVSEAKDRVRTVLYPNGQAATFQDFNDEVVCRCGRDVMIRRIPDQWFIRYSDEALTRDSQAHAATMRVYPEEYRRDLPSVLDWFGDRACIRRGSWLGTEFPFKKEWIIEPISDSTFYSAYYIISPYVNDGRLRPEDLTDEFFDYAFLGRGTPKSPAWQEARKDFEFWYPVDINLGGKEHKTVHFPPYVMNHVALLPAGKRPQGIFVNWWVTQKAGTKISKSKGGAEPIPGAAKKYGVDGMRLYYCHVASAHVDIEWDADVVLRYRSHVERLYHFVLDLAEEPPGSSPPGLDAWLEATWANRLQATRAAFDAYDLRAATNVAFYDLYNDLLWFRRRGGRRSPAVDGLLRSWVATLTPVTPFLAEELWKALGGSGLVSRAQLPSPSRSVDATAVAAENLVRSVLDDVGAIGRVTKITPKRILIYTAPPWKEQVARAVREAVRSGKREVGSIIRSHMADPALKPHAKELAAYVQRAFKDALAQAGADGETPLVDEFTCLSAAREFLARELGVQELSVYRAEDPQAPDPGRKRGAASPGKPALYLD